MQDNDLVGILQRDPSLLTNHELLFLDYCAHYEWRTKGDGKKVYFPNCSPAHLVEVHVIIRREMTNRGFRHLTDDDLDAQSAIIERQRRTSEAGFLRGAVGGVFDPCAGEADA